MLDIQCKDRFKEALDLAIVANCLPSLAEPLVGFEHGGGRCVVTADEAPLCFRFAIVGWNDEQHRAGKLVYSGPGRDAPAGAGAVHTWTVTG